MDTNDDLPIPQDVRMALDEAYQLFCPPPGINWDRHDVDLARIIRHIVHWAKLWRDREVVHARVDGRQTATAEMLAYLRGLDLGGLLAFAVDNRSEPGFDRLSQ